MQAERTALSAETTSRRPLALRELFCLTTLAAICLALVLYSGWNDHERWLLGATLGGALLGILAARMRTKPGWLAGILVGSLGGVIAVGIISREWYDHYLTVYSASFKTAPATVINYRNYYLGTAVAATVLGTLLAALATASYQGLVWLTASGPEGFVAAARRHPYRTAIVGLLAGVPVLTARNSDYLLSPHAWPSRYFIASLPEHARLPDTQVALSRHGDWLSVMVAKHRGDSWPSRTLLYRLDTSAHQIQIEGVKPEQIRMTAFACHEDLMAYWGRDLQANVVHLVTGEITQLKPFHVYHVTHVSYMVWLPNGSLQIVGRKFKPIAGGWSAPKADNTSYQPRLGYLVRWEEGYRNVYDLETSQRIASQPAGPYAALLTSPGARFEIRNNVIQKPGSRLRREFKGEKLFTFTGSGHVVAAAESRWPNNASYPWMHDVPFGARLDYWLSRKPVRLIDPATGREVARTRPLGATINEIAFSHDGSRMAVVNLEGVYVYDVPAEYR